VNVAALFAICTAGVGGLESPAPGGLLRPVSSVLRQPSKACVPTPSEYRKKAYRSFAGLHYIPQLKGWWYEVPKAGSTTFHVLFDMNNHQLPVMPAGGPSKDDIGFAIARHPVERAVSAWHTAYGRAAPRANKTDSPCPFSRFPYLQKGISDSDGLLRAIALLREKGVDLASSACGAAYPHMLSQSYFLSRKRMHNLYGKGPLVKLPPPPTVLLRLEHLFDDLRAFCALRNASAFCEAAIARRGERVINTSRKATISAEAMRAVKLYYEPDFDCLGYERTDRYDAASSG
jgi:hypothetical protein